MDIKTCWEKWDEKTKKEAMAFCEPYKKFLSENKTERLFVKSCIKLAEKSGFKPLDNYKKLSAGDRFYKVNKNKLLILGTAGRRPVTSGCRFIVAHIDSPRLDLKTSPLYQDEQFCLLKTYYYGTIKKYQWLTIPLAIYGTVVLKNGEKKEIVIGEKEGDPVLTITDLTPNLSKDQMKKTVAEGFPGENLNAIMGSLPVGKNKKEPVKGNVLKILKSLCGMDEEDFLSSEFQLVPAGKMRDAALDKSMVLGYGQDDRVGSYGAFKALIETDSPEHAAFCILVDQEEIGSAGATSGRSEFLRFTLEEVVEKSGFASKDFKTAVQNSKALSADVDLLLDPNFKEVYDLRNTARPGCGIIISKNTGIAKAGCIEPTAEYLAFIRKLFDENGVCWQTGEQGKLEQGSGGTVAAFFAWYNMDTVDCKTGIFSMHAPYELTHKADIYSSYLAYRAFYK